MTDFVSSTGDGYVFGLDAVYATARNTSFTYDTIDITVAVGQAAGYAVYRSYLKFDTSSIPVGATVTQVNMSLTAIGDNSDTDFNIHIRKYDWSGQDPIGAGNCEAAYDGLLAATLDVIWRNTSGMAINTAYVSPNMNTAWVVPGGSTYYGLLSDRDIGAATPTGNEFITVASASHATASYRPTLTVMYTTTSFSKVIRVDYSNIGKVSGVAIASIGKVAGVA